MKMTMRYPGGLKKAVTFSYDDGVKADERLIGIMVKYGIRGTFNLNGCKYVDEDRKMLELAQKIYLPNGMEIACHGFRHPFYSDISEEDSEEDIRADKETMKKCFGLDVRGFAYPYNSFNDTTIALLKKHGFVYSRTCFATADFGLPEEPLFLKPTCHHADEGVEEMIDKFFAEKTDEPRMFYLWGHSYEFDDNDNWDYIENICKKIGGRDGIWYATNIEIIDYLNAFRALTVTDNGIINDSDKKIWACADGKEIVIEPHSSYGF